ncbi:olfactory receptor class A-like protein 1 [Lepisosteus oculatus]|uniref:olfactory receptor class A-like protein 1 n=1 Tax=Lepisosteus oculatus TaxID=7918 RepID=UPI0003EABCD6|nr:PREDICTED: vomeronasal type-1 receptor 1-like [Lepisosteus oculatus]
MDPQVVIRGMLYLFLVVVGVPGNLAVIWAFCHIMRSERKLMPADAIVLHLAAVNLLVAAVRCSFEALAAFGVLYVFNNTGCKTIIFIYRTSRSLSIWLTFVLSTFQCISIVPPGSRGYSIKSHAPRYLGGVFVFLWILNSWLSSAALAFAVSSGDNSTRTQYGINIEFCIVNFPSSTWKNAVGAVQVARDAVPIFLMVAASLFILLFLYRHSQQVKGLRSAKRTQKESAESRAAKTVVTLVTLYVLFYGIDNGLWVYTLTVTQTLSTSLISDLRIFFASLYAAVSPLVIIASNKKVKSQLGCMKTEKGPVSVDTVLSTV